jgi:glycosyltransferase involved in cell wall biosynthesis
LSTIALCIPAYNAEHVLPALLSSAKKQALPFAEILVYNDCSTDNTAAVAMAYGAKVINGTLNKGCSFGKNELAKLATSRWLHFHDADDELLPNFSTVAKKWMESEDSSDIILLHYLYVDFMTGHVLGEPSYNRSELKLDAIKFMIENKVVNFALIKRAAFNKIEGFDTDVNVLYNEDKAFYTRAAIAGLSFDYEEETTCINYFYKASMSASNQAKCALAQYHLLQKVSKYASEIAEQLYQNATFSCTYSQWETSKNAIALAKKIAPNYIPKGSPLFTFLFKITANWSFVIRELLVRNFKRAKN